MRARGEIFAVAWTVALSAGTGRAFSVSPPDGQQRGLPLWSSEEAAAAPSLPSSSCLWMSRNMDDAEDSTTTTNNNNVWESIQSDLQRRWEIAKDSNANGSGFKQVMADVLAGDYDDELIQQQIEADIRSAPVVLYTWENSPSCKAAIKALETALGATPREDGASEPVRIIRLDDPWSEGHPVRAQLGKRVGRTSVPCIFIGGTYAGGFDAGAGPEAPGIQAMAFQGTLRPALEAAGVKLSSTPPAP